MCDVETMVLRAEVPPPQEGYEVVFQRADTLSEKQFTYCPGCMHGMVHHLIAEVIDELGIKNRMHRHGARGLQRVRLRVLRL